jgi:lipid II isoglutaminyl synthase (glutamine-hydrolysing)
MYWLTITLAKFINFIIQFLNLGAGYTWPGHFALKMYPALLNEDCLYPTEGLIYVSATNGKTTTTKLIAHILEKSGYKVVTNTSGANLLNGIASVLLLDTSYLGKPRSSIGVFEVDEFALPLLLEKKSPNVLLLLNLSRDQLDRYGETDTILSRWQESIQKLPDTTQLIVDSTQEQLSNLSDKQVYFDDTFIANLNTKLHGVFITKNVNAALKAVSFFGIAHVDAVTALDDFEYAWGRGEKLVAEGIDWTLMLAKNPASFNSNLAELLTPTSPLFKYENYLFILNDNIPDGRDVSWIYDISAEKLAEACKNKKIYISGTRAFDMAVRLGYAGVTVAQENISLDLVQIINKITADSLKEVLVLPNYSAMLQFRKLLKGKSIL